MAEVQRLEEKERRKFEEKERRVAQERMRVQKEAELAARVSAREVSHKFMEELMIDVFTNLDSDGFFFDPYVTMWFYAVMFLDLNARSRLYLCLIC